MKFVKGSLLLAGAAVLLTACGSVKAAPIVVTDTPVSVPTVSAPTSASTPAVQPIEVKPKGPRTVDVAIIQGIHKGARVTWVQGKIVKADVNNVDVVPVEGAQPQTAEISADATFFDPLECGEPQGVTLDSEGLGALECSRDEYQSLAGHYGTKIFFNDAGEIVKMADRYHP